MKRRTFLTSVISAIGAIALAQKIAVETLEVLSEPINWNDIVWADDAYPMRFEFVNGRYEQANKYSGSRVNPAWIAATYQLFKIKVDGDWVSSITKRSALS